MSDRVRYSVAAVEAGLPGVFDPSYILRPPKNGPLEIKGGGRPEALNDWQLTVADVCRAYYRCGLEPLERDALRNTYERGMSGYQIAGVWQLPPDDVFDAIESGKARITQWLNGRGRTRR